MNNKENSKKYKLAILTSHPIQYQAPLFKKLAQHPKIDLTVYFCSDHGVTKKVDPGFGVAFKWDIPLLEGYRYKFLKNYFPFISGNRLWLSVNLGIIKELWKEKYDAILIHGYVALSGWLAFLGTRLSKTPILFRGETILRPGQSRLKRVVKSLCLKALFRKIDAFLPIGTRSREFYLAYDVPESRMFLTPYSVDNEFFHRKYKELIADKNKLKEKLGIPSEMPIILYASKMIPRKRAIDLLKAFKMVQEKRNAVLVFVGDGVERPVLESYTKEHNLKNVYFVGFKNQTELSEYFVVADVFVLPSTNEPWGLIINEVMNFGLPIITTDKVGAGPDLVKDGENGFIYSIGDIERLAECLLTLLKELELRERMGRCSLEIISNWGYDACVEGVLKGLRYVRQ
ncbi:MAG: glycosyltransferase family 4 protein [Candidatus Atribacteria bacterium]